MAALSAPKLLRHLTCSGRDTLWPPDVGRCSAQATQVILRIVGLRCRDSPPKTRYRKRHPYGGNTKGSKDQEIVSHQRGTSYQVHCSRLGRLSQDSSRLGRLSEDYPAPSDAYPLVGPHVPVYTKTKSMSLLRLTRSETSQPTGTQGETQGLRRDTVSGYPLRKSAVRHGVC